MLRKCSMRYIFRYILVLCLFALYMENVKAQKDSITDISALIYLDSFVVTASRQGFDTDDFIKMVRTDDSFLEAFHNLRFISYRSTNQFTYFDKKQRVRAVYLDTIQQTVDQNCRTMDFIAALDEGSYFKKRKSRKYNYFTSDMHDRLFYTHRKTCDDPNPKLKNAGSSRFEKYVFELKKLIFRPGEPADVPFIGDKTSIFTEPMIQFYDFKIESDTFKDNFECYVFEASVKPEFENKNKVVIKHLKTYFDKSTFQVIGRDYQLQYSAGLYQFDVNMIIELLKLEEKYYPASIQYEGFWNVPIKKRESSKFTLQFFDYKKQSS